MNMPLLGPAGIQRRIAQIEQRIAETVGAPSNLEGTTEPGPLLAGPIGESGNAPMNPFGTGVSLNRSALGDQLGPMIQSAASQAGVDPALFDALIASESAYDPNARSRAGAMGLSQLMPGTAQALGVANPFDPSENLRGGAQYLSQMLQRFGGDPRLALAAYNAGPGAVERHGGVPPYAETQAYVRKVMGLFEARRQP